MFGKAMQMCYISRAQFQDALFSLVAGLNLTQIQQTRFFLIGYCVAHFFLLVG